MTNQNETSELVKQLNLNERVGSRPRETRVWKRAKDLIYHPNETWRVVAQEEGGIAEAFFPYCLWVGFVPTAAITLFFSMLVSSIFGMLSIFGGGEGALGSFLSVPNAVFGLVSVFALWLVALLVMGKVLEMCAPMFGLRQSWVLSCRVLIYSSTPMWLVAAISWIPLIGWLFALLAMVRSLWMVLEGSKIVLQKPVADGKSLVSPAQPENKEFEALAAREKELV